MKLVLTTCSPGEAAGLARSLVEARLAACCNQLPAVRSTYWWQGELTTDDEVLLIFKTRDDLLARLMAALQDAHPYDVPEIVALEPAAVNGPYAAWVTSETC